MEVLELEKEVKNLRETIYLFKFLFPENSFRKPEKPAQEFNENNKATSLKLLSSLFKNSSNNYDSLFINLSKDSSFKKDSPLDISKEIEHEEPFKDSKNNSCSLITNFTPGETSKDDTDLNKQKKPKIPNLALTLNNQNEMGFNGSNAIFNNKQNAPKMKIPHLKLTMTGACGDSNEGNIENEEGEEEAGGEGSTEKVEKGMIVMKEEHISVEFPKKSFRKDKESSFDERNSENSIKRAQIKNLELSRNIEKNVKFVSFR